MFRIFLSICFALLIVLRPGAQSTAAEKTFNLLTYPQKSIATTTVRPAEKSELPKLTDGRASTNGRFSCEEGTPLEIVYTFGGKLVSPSTLTLSLPATIRPDTASIPASVEILISDLSATAGFQSLRSEPLRKKKTKLKISFPAVGGRWIMLRFHPVRKTETMLIAECVNDFKRRSFFTGKTTVGTGAAIR